MRKCEMVWPRSGWVSTISRDIRPHWKASQREGNIGLQSVGHEMRLGSNHLNVPNASCKHCATKFQVKPTSCNDVTLYCRTAPSASVDFYSLRGFANAVEPTSPDPVGAVVENPNRVERILRGYQHTVTPVEVSFSDLVKRTGSLGYRS